MERRPFRLYLAAVARHFWVLMSSAAFTLVGILSLWQNPGNVWLLWINLLLAVFFLLVASYRTWRDEHDAAVSAAPSPTLNLSFKGMSLLHRHIKEERVLHRVSVFNGGPMAEHVEVTVLSVDRGDRGETAPLSASCVSSPTTPFRLVPGRSVEVEFANSWKDENNRLLVSWNGSKEGPRELGSGECWHVLLSVRSEVHAESRLAIFMKHDGQVWTDSILYS
jgi:hypothetical protein